jgi:alpha-tubulin suppressor-like RCC1 family protein
MKKLLSILLLLPVIVFGQWVGGPGEYYNIILNTATHRAYMVINGVPTLITEVTNVVQVIGGPHSCALIDNNGDVWAMGQNQSGVVPKGSVGDQNTFIKCMLDVNGLTLDPVVQVIISGNGNHNINQDYWDIFAVTASGKLYGAGELEGYVVGDGTAGQAINTRWVPINVGSKLVKKVQGGYGMLALCTDGTVYTWGGDRDGFINAQNTTTAATIPTQVSLPGGKTAIDIASNGLVHAVILSDSTKAMTGQQNLNDYTGIYPTAMTRVFQDVTTALGLPAKAKAVYMNSSTTYWLLNNGSLWAHGDNSCGTIGNGDMQDWANYKCCPENQGSPAPYNYGNGFHGHMVISPVEVIPGKRDWQGMGTCPSNSWFAYAWDASGNFYSWGRNKFGTLVNRIIGANPVNGGIGAARPDSWDNPDVTVQDPGSITSYIESTSPYCLLNPSGAPCNTYTPPTNVKPTVSLTGKIFSNSTKIVWDLSGSTDDVFIMRYKHTQVSGNALVYGVYSGKKDTVTTNGNGTYVSKGWVQDNGFLADSMNATVCVGCSPTVSAGSTQTITLPTSSIVLTGTATAAAGNAWATPTYLWTKTSGPGATTITGNTTLTPTMSGLQQGVYIFQLRATDVNSNTNTSTVQITVNASTTCTNCITFPRRASYKFK